MKTKTPISCAVTVQLICSFLGSCKCLVFPFPITHLIYFCMILIGHYCPNGTEFSTQYKCPPGTYNPVNGSTALTDCLECPGGEYCEGEANVAPTGLCYPGWYCSGGSDSPNTTTHGGECQRGTYCPEGNHLILQPHYNMPCLH